MPCRAKTLLISLTLILAASSAVDGNHSCLMAQNQDLTQKQKDERCESIRAILMGDDGTGQTSGLRYSLSVLPAIVKLLQQESDAVRQPISMDAVDKEITADLSLLKGAAPGFQNQDLYNLVIRDLFYWTALKHKMKLAKGYGHFIQQALAQVQQTLNNLPTEISNEKESAVSLHCEKYWASHPLTRQTATEVETSLSTGASGPSCIDTPPGTPERKACCDRLTDPNARFFCYSSQKMNPTDAATFNKSFGNQNPNPGANERIQVVGSYQCEQDQKDTGPLGGATFIFFPAAGGNSVLVTLKNNGYGYTTLPPGTYTLRLPKSKAGGLQFGDAKVLWAQVRTVGGSDQGTNYPATSEVGDFSLNFALVSFPNLGYDYEVEVRVSSLHLCKGL